MNSVSHRTLVLSVIAALLLAPSLAVAANDVIYTGETPTSGMDGYSGANSSDTLWDYVYDLSQTHATGGPWRWAIGSRFEPDTIYGEANGWTAVWDDEIQSDATEYDNVFAGTDLAGLPGVVWEWQDFPATPPTGTFHFQSVWAPEDRPWVVRDTPTYSDEGSEWSANPEPASMLLSALALLGVGYWRKRVTD